MKPNRSPFDQAYIRWLGNFAPFEARCFEALCEFVRVHFDDLLDRYYCEGHESLNDFPAWAFERYIRAFEREMAEERCPVPALRPDATGRLTVGSAAANRQVPKPSELSALDPEWKDAKWKAPR